MPAVKSSIARRWCYTLNNPSSPDASHVLNEHATYHIYEPEVAPETGTPHLQGYVCFKKRVRLTQLKTYLPTAHWEPAAGKPSQNVAYCSKEGAAVIYGVQPKDTTGAADWTAARRAAEEGRLGDIPDDMYIRYRTNFLGIRAENQVQAPPLAHLTGLWIYGESGIGKSRAVREMFPGAYLKPCNKWWDGYRDQPIVYIEDVDPRHKMLAHHYKLWGDHYSFAAEQKGTTITIRPKFVIVTSQYTVSDCFEDFRDIEAITRRYRPIEYTVESAPKILEILLSIKEDRIQ